MAIDRRTWLKRTGAAALGVTLLKSQVGCDDDPSTGTQDASDASDTPTDTTLAPDTTLEDAATETAEDTSATATETREDTLHVDSVGPSPSLSPLRRDGSSPYDYIDTIVILEMENRSFDHYFGALKLVEGRGDVDGLTAEMANLTHDGTSIPVFALGPHWVVDPDPPHGRSGSLAQYANGLNSGFVRAYEEETGDNADIALKAQCMGYHVRDEIPALYGLADAYTLCDQWHCGLLGPTWPNRFFSHAATSDGATSNLSPLSSPTIYSRVMAAGLKYGVYHRSPIYFALTLLDPLTGTYPAADINQFFLDASDGVLPNVTVVEPDYAFDDDHPPHDIRKGQALIRSVYEACRRSPQWDRMLFVVIYDENGGFYDHVPPPVPAGETRDDFKRLGFRIPALVTGGLARRGFVFSETVEHSSLPAMIARIFDLEPTNERMRLAPDLVGALDVELTLDSRRPLPVELPPLDLESRRIEQAFKIARCRQTELEQFVRQRYGIVDYTAAQRRKATERYLEAAVAMKALRIR